MIVGTLGGAMLCSTAANRMARKKLEKVAVGDEESPKDG